MKQLNCRGTALALDQPVVMGVLNVTPDSFSDGGRHADASGAIDQGRRMVDEGAAIIDVGGESTRPGAAPVAAEEEMARVLPVIEGLSRTVAVPISVDTSQPEVMRAAVAAGARMINDVRALRVPGALEAAADSGAAVCLMHMQGEPGDMQANPRYGDVVREVREFLVRRVDECMAAGIARERLCVDPGIGFGKRPEHNLALLARLEELAVDRVPLLVGVSRKSLIGIITGRASGERLAGSIALAALCACRGAAILRAHDVAATVDAVKIGAALRGAGVARS
ncbi:MAG TPA: dihydropteroate synthase [Steroidobacteraceae bacterium]